MICNREDIGKEDITSEELAFWSGEVLFEITSIPIVDKSEAMFGGLCKMEASTAIGIKSEQA